MKLHSLAWLFTLVVGASDMPTGYFHGSMITWEGTPGVGVLSARSEKDGVVYQCRYDSKTYLEYEKHRVQADKFLSGDPLELLVHRRPGEANCYILSGSFAPPPPKQARPGPAKDLKASNLAKAMRPPVERHGTRRLSGVVVDIGDRSFTIRSRQGETETFVFRLDTRFVGDGIRLQRADVHVNQVLEVEAGRNAEGEMEAFQLTWGTLSVHP